MSGAKPEVKPDPANAKPVPATVTVTVAPGRTMMEQWPDAYRTRAIIMGKNVDGTDAVQTVVISSKLRAVPAGKTLAVLADAVPALVRAGMIIDPAKA